MVEVTAEIDALRRENEELRASSARLAERARRFARLRGLTARLASSLDRSALFDEIALAAGELLASTGAALLLATDDNDQLIVEAGQSLGVSRGMVLPRAHSLAGRALDEHRAFAVDDTATEESTLIPTLFGGTRPGAVIVAPIRVAGKPFGVVEVYFADPRSIPDEDVEMLDALSDAAAIALRNATAYARILEQGAQLAKGNDDLARQKEELARLNNELRQANVLKSQFLSTISHELRTPLTSIIGFSSVLLRDRRGETLSDRQRDNASRILSSARHLVTLINDILDLSRIEAGRLDVFRREVDLGELLRNLQAELEAQAHAKNLSFTIEIGHDLNHVVTDADRLRQVLLNLVTNAIKFTHIGGVRVCAERSGDTIRISVQDTGIGVASNQQARIFDDFYQVDQSSTRAAGGTGLGLSISRRLVSLLDGRLTLESTPGEGSTFTVLLPATPSAQAIAGPSRTVPVGPAKDRARVLVIDDDPEMVVLLERALEGTHYAIIGALSADEGLDKIHELQPDAILLDVMMPETDGWRTLHRIKSDARIAHIPVVMHTIVADKALGFSLGATDYLVKPVEREHLLKTLNRLTPLESGPVLVVDDDENIRVLLANTLSDERIPVMLASNGAEALRIVTERLPRMILLDLMMPDIDGFTVLQRLRADPHTRHIPVVVITAKTLTEAEQDILREQSSMVVTKNGISLERLLDEIRGALEVVR